MNEEPKNLMLTMDAKEWADEFINLWGPRMGGVDQSLMLSWFAAAIMCGYDHANYKTADRIKVLERVLDAAIVYLDDTCVRTEESLIDAVDAARSGET